MKLLRQLNIFFKSKFGTFLKQLNSNFMGLEEVFICNNYNIYRTIYLLIINLLWF